VTSKRSAFEETVGATLEPLGFSYEAVEFMYWTPSKYTPDFSLGTLHVEVKGWFRPGDRKKYKSIAESIQGAGEHLVFLLQNGNKKCSKHNKITMGEWCDKHKIPWFSTPEELWEWWDGADD